MATKTKKTKVDVIDRIKTIDDVLNELGEKDEQVLIYRKLLTLFDSTSHTVNYQLAILITKSLNEGWIPDWNNSDEWKYSIWFWMGGSSGFRCYDCARWGSDSAVGSRLCFKESRLGKHAAKQFLSVFENFMTIKK